MASNKELLSIRETADSLGVSVSTIRRWSEEGILDCFRVGKAGYRKYEREKVEELKRQFYGETSNDENTNEHHVIETSIEAEAHPAHYLMHKYWGRKAHNIISEYISFYTKQGDTIVEPFMGSGVTVIEGIKQKRHVIGIDINPMSEFIVDNTISNADLELFSEEYARIVSSVKDKYSYLYQTRCPECEKNGFIETAIWENDQLVRIKGICSSHGTFIKDADDYDKEIYQECVSLKEELLAHGELDYPTEPIMQYVKRSGRNRIDELFSDRALIILSTLKSEIMKVSDETVKSLLLFCFTSMLPNVSRMLPGDKEKATYKSGWVISKFWTPKIHTERNIFLCLQLRFNAILKGKKELQGVDSSLAELYTADSSDLSFIESESVDYILTDPPYGESIAYLALSQFWNSWLPNKVDYESEIIIDPYRKKGYEDYAERTKKAYREFYRVLKKDHYMSFTFNNRDLNVWKAILEACSDAGFVLENIVMQKQAVSSGTQGINKKNTLTGDFIYNFRKTDKKKALNVLENDAASFVLDNIYEFIEMNEGATPQELYEYIIPIIVQNNAYTDKNGRVISIESILKSHFKYVELKDENSKRIGGAYKWVKV